MEREGAAELSESEKLSEALIESTWKEEAFEAIKDLGEVALDGTLDEGLLRDLPVVGWAFGGVRIVRQLQDRLFLRKLALFLNGPSKLPPETREQFMERMDVEPAYKRQIGEGVLLLIDRHEHFEKSEVLGWAFAAFMKEDVEYQLFRRMATAIDRSGPGDFEKVLLLESRSETEDYAIGQDLVALGAASVQYLIDVPHEDATGATINDEIKARYKLNETGQALASILSVWGPKTA